MTYKVDFHTHSIASPDGSLTLAQYRRILERGRLDCIAVTDHDTIRMAEQVHAALGAQIIVGEEITTRDGEIIGLYLTEAVPPQLSAQETIRAIVQQGGMVYIPHPFETLRKGITRATLDAVADGVDIIEAHNGRAVFQDYSKQALGWAHEHKIPVAAGSDAHGVAGWGKTYTMLDALPTRGTLIQLLGNASYERGFPGLRGVLYPKLNRLRKRGRGH